MLETQELVTFKPNSLIGIQDFKATDWLSTLLTDDEWDVSQGRYQLFEHMHLLNQVQTLKISQLKIRWTKNQSVIKELSPISFPSLKQLFLNGNSLASIEPISQAYFPCLEILNLKQNEIRHISALRRCNMPNLKDLSLYKNKIIDADKLSQLQCPKLNKLWMNGKVEDGNIIISINWIAKLQPNKLKALLIEHHRRIEQTEAIEAIQRKINGKVEFCYSTQDDRGLNWL